MKIKLDENLPIELKKVLVLAGHDVHSVRDERLEGHPDREVWESAQRESRFFLTQDLGFADLRNFSPGSHSGILLLRLQPADRRDMIQRISEIFRAYDPGDWTGCLVVATESKVRVVSPRPRIN